MEMKSVHDIPLPRVPTKNYLYNKKLKYAQLITTKRLPPLPKVRITKMANNVIASNVNKTWTKEYEWKHMEQQTILSKIANNVICKKKNKPLSYRGLMKTHHKHVWENSLSNKLGCLMQGVGTGIKSGTETLVSIVHNEMPKGKNSGIC